MTGRRTITPEELQEILAEHEHWLETDGREGRCACLRARELRNAALSGRNLKKAVLSGADLTNADLSFAQLQDSDLSAATLDHAKLAGAQLQSANLTEATLEGTNLEAANLTRATLTRATLENTILTNGLLQYAILTKARLKDSDLTNADLEEVRGLSVESLAGADLTGTRLPSYVVPLNLSHVGETSRHARAIFNTLLIACGYSILTILTTTDERLVTNASASPIPFTGTEAPVLWFFYLMPFVVMLLYVYLLSYLWRLWKQVKELPAIFTDGTLLTSTTYPWILSDLTRRAMPRLDHSRGTTRGLDYIAVFFMGFGPLITLFLFWWSYLPQHDAVGTALQALAVSVAAVLTGLFIQTVAYDAGARLSSRSSARRPSWTLALSSASILTLFYIISLGEIWGNTDRFESVGLGGCSSGVIPNFLCHLGIRPFLDLQHKNLSDRPVNWQDPDIHIEQEIWSGPEAWLKTRPYFQPVEGADLDGFNLRSANAQKAFLAKASLLESILNGIDLRWADLRWAILSSATANDAHMEFADLRLATLIGTELNRAFLNGADLRNASLIQADLRQADLSGADLRGANLSGANLSDVIGVTREQLEAACGDDTTILPQRFYRLRLQPCA